MRLTNSCFCTSSLLPISIPDRDETVPSNSQQTCWSKKPLLQHVIGQLLCHNLWDRLQTTANLCHQFLAGLQRDKPSGVYHVLCGGRKKRIGPTWSQIPYSTNLIHLKSAKKHLGLLRRFLDSLYRHLTLLLGCTVSDLLAVCRLKLVI